MTDLIERLKAELFTMRNVFHQQDAEIERLTRSLDQLKQLNLANSTLIEEQEAEVERLRRNLKLANESCGEWADANEEYEAENEHLQAHNLKLTDANVRLSDKVLRLQAWKDEHSRTEGGECPYCEIDDLRDALERIANPITEDDVHWINTDEIVSIAREALKHE